MMTTEVFNIRDKTKEAVYLNWQTNDIITTTLDTLPKKGTLWGVIIKPTYAELTNISLISKVAEDWQLLGDKIWEKPFDVSPISSITSTISDVVVDFCLKHNILSEYYKYKKIFFETFKNIQKITVSISEDPEIPNYHHVCFILTIADSIKNVLRYEDNFRKALRKIIPPGKRQFFVYNYNLI